MTRLLSGDSEEAGWSSGSDGELSGSTRASGRRELFLPGRKSFSVLACSLGVIFVLLATLAIVAVVRQREASGSAEAPGEGAGGLRTASAPAYSVLAAPAPARELCDTVVDCEKTTCETARSNCWQKVKDVMSNPAGLWTYNDFTAKHGDYWYPSQGEQWRGQLSFENYQYLVHMHEPGEGICPKPCFTSSPQTAATQPAPRKCPPPAAKLPPPTGPLDYNGKSLPEMCFEPDSEGAEEHVLIIGDWGGYRPGQPADNTDKSQDRPAGIRPFVDGIDNMAQLLVAEQFNKRAAVVNPSYILNVGDNFYWGGCYDQCATKTVAEAIESFKKPPRGAIPDGYTCAGQFYNIFETMYMGPGLDGKPWISCLGNHDYGGYYFNAGWDQQIAYTWGPSERWVLPAQYYHLPVRHAAQDITIDYYIIDTNVADVQNETLDPHHNICNAYRNPTSDCRPFGPANAWDCVGWFRRLWQEQLEWLPQVLDKSTADWQIIMTHIPPESCVPYPRIADDIREISEKYGVDLLIAGHRHVQEIYPEGQANFNCMDGSPCRTAGVPYVVSGGGGGITSDFTPGTDGNGQDMYGYMDMTVTKTEIKIEAFNQFGVPRGVMQVHPRERA